MTSFGCVVGLWEDVCPLLLSSVQSPSEVAILLVWFKRRGEGEVRVPRLSATRSQSKVLLSGPVERFALSHASFKDLGG